MGMAREEAIKQCEDFIKHHSDWSVEIEWAKGMEFVLEDYKRLIEQEPCDDWCDVPSDEMTLGQARQAVKDLRKKLAEYLEQEPTTKNDLGVDCISRKAILDELEKWDWQELYLPIHFKQMLDELPSITPQPRKGHWIDEGIYADGQSYHSFMCSECGWHHIEHKNEIVDFKYCPFCRADMRGDEE